MDLMTTGSVMQELGISRMTLYKWIEKKIVPVWKVDRGGRSFFMFNAEDIRRVKSRLKPVRPKGKSLLKESKGGKKR